MALVYWFGGLLSKKGLSDFSQLFRVFLAFVNTSRTIGEAGALTPDNAKASIAIKSIFFILDRRTKINSDVKDAEIVKKVDGSIELKNVYFRLPIATRCHGFHRIFFEDPSRTNSSYGGSEILWVSLLIPCPCPYDFLVSNVALLRFYKSMASFNVKMLFCVHSEDT